MNKRDIVIGLVILAILAGVVFFRQQKEEEEIIIPQTLSVEDRIEESFKIEIPEDVDKAELRDVSGGNASAIATRKYENKQFEHSVLADLAEPPDNQFYQGWLVRGEDGREDYSVISTGQMRIAKGGWIIDYKSSTDYTDHEKVVVTLEEVLDSNPEKHILEGSF